MAVDPLNTWKSTLADLPKTSDLSWSINFANWYADRIVNISTNPTNLTVPSFTFVFDKVLFAAQLASLLPTVSQLQGVTGFSNAWLAPIALILFPLTLSVPAGSFIPPSSPATLFSTITSVILDPASVALAQSKILELAFAPVVSDPMDSLFAEKFREATLLLKINVTGLNSIPPPAGPLPLAAVQVPLI